MFVCLVGLALFLSSRAVLLGVLVTHTPWHPGIRCVAFDVRCVAFAGSPGSALSPVDACEAYAESDAGSGTGSAMDGATAADDEEEEEGWGVMRMLSGVFGPLFGGGDDGGGGGSVAGSGAGSGAGSDAGSGSGADVGASVAGSVFNGGSVAGSVYGGGSVAGSVLGGGSVAGSMVDLDGADPGIDSIDTGAGDTGSVGGWLAGLFKTGDQEAQGDNNGVSAEGTAV
jgi:hypothetical protein